MTLLLQYPVDALSLGSLYALAAIGIGMVFNVMRIVNFAHGDFITISAFALIVPSSNDIAVMLIGAVHPVLTVILVCMIALCFAVIFERLVFRPLRSAPAPVMMIASFALGFSIQKFILLIYGSRPKAVNLWPELIDVIELSGVIIPKIQLVIIAITVVLLTAIVLLFRFTSIGLQMRAAADDFETATLLGVEANRVIGAAFALSGILAAVVALMLASQTGVISPTFGVQTMLFALIAAVIGGSGSLLGAVIGGLLLGILSTFFQAIAPAELRPFRDAFVFGAVILVLLVFPNGLVPANGSGSRV